MARLLEPSLETGLPLMKNVLEPLAICVIIPLRLTAAESATDATVHKKMLGSGRPLDLPSRITTLIASNGDMNDIMKIIKSLEESDLLRKGVTETIKN